MKKYCLLFLLTVSVGCSMVYARKVRCSVEHGGFLASTKEYDVYSCLERAKTTCKREPNLVREGRNKDGKFLVYSCE